MESITDHSKQSFSVMFSGNAASVCTIDGCVQEKCVRNWTRDGPRGNTFNKVQLFNFYGAVFSKLNCIILEVVYGSTESGWFELNTFDRWFHEVLFLHLVPLPGNKVIIGDNLGCYLGTKVIVSCGRQISFVCLIANSTHLCQPLVALWFTVL